MTAQAAAELQTIIDLIRYGASRFNAAGLTFGHSYDNALDEATSLVLHTLHLPPDLGPAYGQARLLADIEKLIKQTIKRGDLAGFNPAPVYASEERGERRGRRDEAPRSGSGSSRTGERVAPRTGSSSFAPRREKVDPWFLKPYEPAKAPAPASSATLSTATPATTKPKQKLAFLLGGVPRA